MVTAYKLSANILIASKHHDHRDVAQPGSAPHWGCGGRRFKSGHPDHLK